MYHITMNYGQSHINAGFCLVVTVKCTVTKLNVQYSALLVTSCHQNSLLASQIIQHVDFLLINAHLVLWPAVKSRWKEINARATI